MAQYNELLVSASDAELLSLIVGDRRRSPGLEADAADALADLLLEARMVPHEHLPADCIALNSRVTYSIEPGGQPRTMTLVHPNEANPATGRISVLSPVGRALLGRRCGETIEAGVPGRPGMTLRVLTAERSES